MRRRQVAGTKYLPGLDHQLDNNQDAIVDELTTPHSTRLNEMLGAKHQIVASYAPHHDPQMPIRGQGSVVWNDAFQYQPHGPSFLDPVPDSETVPYAK